MDTTLIVISYIIGSIIGLCILYSIIKAAINNSILGSSTSPSIGAGSNHHPFVRILLSLSRVVYCKETELLLIARISKTRLYEITAILKEAGYITINDDRYQITDRGLIWIRNFDLSQPQLSLQIKNSMQLLKFVHANFKDKRFNSRQLKACELPDNEIRMGLDFLAKRYYLIESTSDGNFGEYRINKEADVSDLLG